MGRRGYRSAERSGGAPGLLRSAAATLVTGSATGGLLLLLEALAARPLGLDGAVAVAVVGVGSVAAAALTCGSLLLLTSALADLLGRSSASLDMLTVAVTPAVLRRAVAVTISAGVGLGMASPAVAEEVDLGWAPTSVGAQSDDLSGRHDPTSSPVASTTSTPRAGVRPDESHEPSDQSLDPSGAASLRTVSPAAPGPRPTSVAAGPSPSAVVAATPAATTTPTTRAVTPGAASPAAPGSDTQRSAEQPTTTSTTGTPRSVGTADVVVVRAGDSLWSIAAAHLPDDSTTAQVAAAWPRWYETNRQAVGADPDLIRPGLELAIPGSADVPQEDS